MPPLPRDSMLRIPAPDAKRSRRSEKVVEMRDFCITLHYLLCITSASYLFQKEVALPFRGSEPHPKRKSANSPF